MCVCYEHKHRMTDPVSMACGFEMKSHFVGLFVFEKYWRSILSFPTKNPQWVFCCRMKFNYLSMTPGAPHTVIAVPLFSLISILSILCPHLQPPSTSYILLTTPHFLRLLSCFFCYPHPLPSNWNAIPFFSAWYSGPCIYLVQITMQLLGKKVFLFLITFILIKKNHDH